MAAPSIKLAKEHMGNFWTRSNGGAIGNLPAWTGLIDDEVQHAAIDILCTNRIDQAVSVVYTTCCSFFADLSNRPKGFRLWRNRLPSHAGDQKTRNAKPFFPTT